MTSHVYVVALVIKASFTRITLQTERAPSCKHEPVADAAV
jgi:hypothetical protein